MLLIAFATWKELKVTLGTSRPPVFDFCQEWELAGQKCLLLITGIGPIQASLTIGQVFGAYQNIEGVLNLGIAGSFDTSLLTIGDIAVVSSEIWPEFGLRKGQEVKPQALGMPLLRSGFRFGPQKDQLIWNKLELCPQKASEIMGIKLDSAWPLAKGITLAGIAGNAQQAKYFKDSYSCQLANMEGFALALACAQKNIPFLQVRTISDYAGEKTKNKHDIGRAFNALHHVWHKLFKLRTV